MTVDTNIPESVHSKTCIVDDKFALIGSAKNGSRSARMARRLCGAALCASLSAEALAHAEEPYSHLEASVLGGYGAWVDRSSSAAPPGNPFGVGLGARAGVLLGGELHLWLGAYGLHHLGTSTTSHHVTVVAPRSAYSEETHHAIDDIGAEVGLGFRSRAVSVRGYAALGVALDHTCRDIRGIPVPGTNPSCSTMTGGGVGLGLTILAPVLPYLSVGLDARRAFAGFATGCLDGAGPGCEGGGRTVAGVYAIVAATY